MVYKEPEKHKEKIALYKKDQYQKNKEKYRLIGTAYKSRLKNMVLEHYGSWCNCCGEMEPLFLSIDHVNNDGYKNPKRSSFLARQVIQEGYPNTYQILCMSCNFGKARNKGVCPHATRGKT